MSVRAFEAPERNKDQASALPAFLRRKLRMLTLFSAFASGTASAAEFKQDTAMQNVVADYMASHPLPKLDAETDAALDEMRSHLQPGETFASYQARQQTPFVNDAATADMIARHEAFQAGIPALETLPDPRVPTAKPLIETVSAYDAMRLHDLASTGTIEKSLSLVAWSEGLVNAYLNDQFTTDTPEAGDERVPIALEDREVLYNGAMREILFTHYREQNDPIGTAHALHELQQTLSVQVGSTTEEQKTLDRERGFVNEELAQTLRIGGELVAAQPYAFSIDIVGQAQASLGDRGLVVSEERDQIRENWYGQYLKQLTPGESEQAFNDAAVLLAQFEVVQEGRSPLFQSMPETRAFETAEEQARMDPSRAGAALDASERLLETCLTFASIDPALRERIGQTLDAIDDVQAKGKDGTFLVQTTDDLAAAVDQSLARTELTHFLERMPALSAVFSDDMKAYVALDRAVQEQWISYRAHEEPDGEKVGNMVVGIPGVNTVVAHASEALRDRSKPAVDMNDSMTKAKHHELAELLAALPQERAMTDAKTRLAQYDAMDDSMLFRELQREHARCQEQLFGTDEEKPGELTVLVPLVHDAIERYTIDLSRQRTASL